MSFKDYYCYSNLLVEPAAVPDNDINVWYLPDEMEEMLLFIEQLDRVEQELMH